MIFRLLIAFALLFGSKHSASAQSYEPLELAKMIFSKNSMRNIGEYVTGGYKGKPNGKDLQTGTTTRFMLLNQNENKAVVAMTVLDTSGRGLDTYLHFVKTDTWKMTAFRVLAMTGMIASVKEGLESLSVQQVDSIVKLAEKNTEDEGLPFKSKEEYEFQLGNSRLILALDEEIIRHFKANQQEFERLKVLALEQPAGSENDEERASKLLEQRKAEYSRIFISSISNRDIEFNNCINFTIGGMIDNVVGYIYIKDLKDLPEMNPDRIIMLREIGDGWYIYKTT